MQIIKYELTKNSQYNVYLSNGEILNLDEKVITENELLLKKEIDTKLYLKLTKENNIYKIYNSGIKYITIRLRSIKEVREYFIRKNYDADEADIAISKLIENGYLDDNKFAKAYVKDKLMFTTHGDYKIRKDLLNLGVSESIIEENLAKIDTNIIDEKIKKIIEKDLKTNKKYTGAKLKSKIYNHLLTGGYSKERVINIINTYDF